MKTITCDICGKKIRSYCDYLFKMRIKLPEAIDTKDPKYHLCEDCYGDMIKFMNGIRNELKRDKDGTVRNEIVK